MPAITMSNFEVLNHSFWTQCYASNPEMAPVRISSDLVTGQATSVTMQSNWQYVDGYSPVRGGHYCYYMYIRFQLGAPQGTGIQDAIINLYSAGGEAATVNWEISAVASDNVSATPAGTAYLPSGAPTGTAFVAVPKTASRVSWPLSGSIPSGTLTPTPDLGPILTEVVNRPGWVSGNYVGLMFAIQSTADLTVFYGTNFHNTFLAWQTQTARRFFTQTWVVPAQRPAGAGDYVYPPDPPVITSVIHGPLNNSVTWYNV